MTVPNRYNGRVCRALTLGHEKAVLAVIVFVACFVIMNYIHHGKIDTPNRGYGKEEIHSRRSRY